MTYQYCAWGSAADEIMKEEIKAIVNDIQKTVQDHGWMSAQRQVYELGKKQFQDSWKQCEWGDVRQQKPDEINMTRTRKPQISAYHMLDGFHYICKPQWKEGMAVMTQKDIMMQYVLMRIFTHRESWGVSMHPEQGYAWMHKYIDKLR